MKTNTPSFQPCVFLQAEPTIKNYLLLSFIKIQGRFWFSGSVPFKNIMWLQISYIYEKCLWNEYRLYLCPLKGTSEKVRTGMCGHHLRTTSFSSQNSEHVCYHLTKTDIDCVCCCPVSQSASSWTSPLTFFKYFQTQKPPNKAQISLVIMWGSKAVIMTK